MMKYNLWYSSMIADANSSIYPPLVKHVKEHPTEKLECVQHVLKDMFHRLASRRNSIRLHKERLFTLVKGSG